MPDGVAIQVVDEDLHVPVRVGPHMLEAELGAEDEVVQLYIDRRRGQVVQMHTGRRGKWVRRWPPHAFRAFFLLDVCVMNVPFGHSPDPPP